jgi:hypothetical protein
MAGELRAVGTDASRTPAAPDPESYAHRVRVET